MTIPLCQNEIPHLIKKNGMESDGATTPGRNGAYQRPIAKSDVLLRPSRPSLEDVYVDIVGVEKTAG